MDAEERRMIVGQRHAVLVSLPLCLCSSRRISRDEQMARAVRWAMSVSGALTLVARTLKTTEVSRRQDVIVDVSVRGLVKRVTRLGCDESVGF